MKHPWPRSNWGHKRLSLVDIFRAIPVEETILVFPRPSQPIVSVSPNVSPVGGNVGRVPELGLVDLADTLRSSTGDCELQNPDSGLL